MLEPLSDTAGSATGEPALAPSTLSRPSLRTLSGNIRTHHSPAQILARMTSVSSRKGLLFKPLLQSGTHIGTITGRRLLRSG